MTRRAQKPRKTQAVLDEDDLKRIRTAARNHTVLSHTLIEWIYTNGARASEPGLARVQDVDLHNGTVMLAHLKGGLEPKPVPMAEKLRTALKAWLVHPARTHRIRVDAAGVYVFPSAKPITCYPCRGTKQLTVKARRRGGDAKVMPCPHCHATGIRYGMTRHEVDRVVVAVMQEAGIPPEFHYPHILRHSAVTHMLNGEIAPPAIQERVGHKALATTFGYMHTTKKARAAVTKVFDEDE